MKTFAPILSFALAVAASTVQAAGTPPPRTPLLSADCIKTSQINDWRIVSARTAIVRTGPKRYLVTLQNDCPQLSHPPGLIFRSSQSGINEGRICGSIGETVRSRHQPACAIESVSLIDKARFEQLTEDAKHYRSSNTPAH
ncbi:DUF6491 family protein [Rhodanobacter sp. Col0626]|uniref:DUF6491 family protein n=1 Tax=Rhodanobacter sp. Col0626 TaxID=3415679 RepID=UPI003CEFA84C